MIRCIFVLLVLLSSASALRAQTTIELRSSAAIKAGSAITLADIADITGDDSDHLRDAVVLDAPAARHVEVSLQQVRTVLDARKVRWGRTTLRGSACTVTVNGFDEGAQKKRRAAAAEPQSPTAVSITGPETVRTHVAQALTRLYAVQLSDLRMLFENDDAELLNTATANRRVDIQPTNSAATSRVGLRIYVFAADRLVSQRTISVEVLVKRSVVTAVAPIQRRQTIGQDDLSVSEQWHAPSAAVPCTPQQAIGAVARARINAGQMITLAAIEAPLVVKKGDIVEVHCLSGAIHLKATRARALAAGRDGDLVEFQLDGSRNTFKARMSGRGSAVMVLDAPALTDMPAAPSSSSALEIQQ